MGTKSSVKQVSLRYAKAVFLFAKEKKTLQKTGEDFASLVELIDSSDDLERVFSSPLVYTESQFAIANKILEKTNLCPAVQGLVKTLANHRRMDIVIDIYDSFAQLVAIENNEVSVTITSAEELEEAKQSSIVSALENKLSNSVNVSFAIDKSILGGLVIETGSLMLDDSIKSKLERLRLISKAAVA
jgi:F-type H+-transporting ATPase subunit delta